MNIRHTILFRVLILKLERMYSILSTEIFVKDEIKKL